MMKGTPTSALQNKCGEMPLALVLQNSIKMQVNTLGNKYHHPCKETTQPHWTDLLKTTQHAQKSTAEHKNSHLLSTTNTIPQPPNSTSAKSHRESADYLVKGVVYGLLEDQDRPDENRS